jgi:hypothetical protein
VSGGGGGHGRPWQKYKVKMAKIQSKIQKISYVFLYVETVPGEVPAKREAPLPAIKEAASRHNRISFPPYQWSLPAKSGLN